MACLSESLFVEYLAGVLPTAEHEVLQCHVDACAQCRELLVDQVHEEFLDKAAGRESTLAQEPAFVDRYQIGDLLGSGSMGAVYEAHDQQLGRDVALKLVGEGISGSDAAQRLVLEAQLLAQLSHPNVVAIYEVGLQNKHVAIAMEKVLGVDLRTWLLSETRSWRQVVGVMVQAGNGLAAAHAAGILHCDIKPSNILVGDDGRVRIGDFGLATTSAGTGPWTDPFFTSAKQGFGGTPAYMAPEQSVLGASEHTDQYAFCVTLHEALLGRRPDADTLDGTLEKRPSIPASLRKLLKHGLAREPAKRFSDMHALNGELKAILATSSDHRWPIALALLVLCILLWAALPFTSDSAHAEPSLALPWSATMQEQQRTQLVGDTQGLGVSYREASASQIQRVLDAYALDWKRERRALEQRQEQGVLSDTFLEEQLHCLDRAAQSFALLVDVLASATDVGRALRSTRELRSIAECQRAEMRPAPKDVKLVRLQDYVNRANLQRILGQSAESKRSIDELSRLLTSGGDTLAAQSLRAQVHYLRGFSFLDSRDYQEAEEQFATGYALAKQGNDLVVRADVASAWMHVVGTHLSRADEASGMLTLVQAEVDAADNAGVNARFLGRLGAVHAAAGRYQDALAAERESLSIMSEIYAGDAPRLAGAHFNLGVSYDQSGNRKQAKIEMEHAAKLIVSSAGRENPTFATIENGLALLAYRMGDYEEAQDRALSSLMVREGIYGKEHRSVASVLETLGALSTKQEEWQKAKGYFARVYELRSKNQGSKHQRLIAASTNLASVMTKLGEQEEAEDILKAAIVELESRFGKADFRIVRALIGLAALYESQPQELETVLAIYLRVLSITEGEFGVAHPRMAEALAAVGQTLNKLERFKEAQAYLERSLPIQIASLEPPEKVAVTRWQLARALAAQKLEPRRRVQLARRAYKTLRSFPNQEQALELRAWMTRAGIE